MVGIGCVGLSNSILLFQQNEDVIGMIADFDYKPNISLGDKIDKFVKRYKDFYN